MVKQGVLAVNPWEEASGLDPEAVHLAHTLVDKYGGEIAVEDNEPTGSTFTVELPKHA